MKKKEVLKSVLLALVIAAASIGFIYIVSQAIEGKEGTVTVIIPRA